MNGIVRQRIARMEIEQSEQRHHDILTDQYIAIYNTIAQLLQKLGEPSLMRQLDDIQGEIRDAELVSAYLMGGKDFFEIGLNEGLERAQMQDRTFWENVENM